LIIGLFALAVGLPIQGHSLRLEWLLPALAAIAIAGFALSRAITRTATIVALSCASVVCLIVISLVWGVSESVVIAGKVAPDTSAPARSLHLSQALIADLYTMTNADQLVAASPSAARANISAYTTASDNLVGISERWLATTSGPQPNQAFTAIETNVGNAAYWEADAVTKKAADVANPDSSVESEIATDTKTYTAQILAAATDLRQLANHYGYKLPGNPSQNG
jgi:endonuclease/exonuclease/phosphatase (EEP) superfamily protein YafD